MRQSQMSNKTATVFMMMMMMMMLRGLRSEAPVGNVAVFSIRTR